MNLTESQGRALHQAGAFPYDQLVRWLETAFAEDYSPAFLPALRRNVRGLVAWVYGDGEEPFWPGADPGT